MKNIFVALAVFLLSGTVKNTIAQVADILPPVAKWNGKSEELIVKNNHPWITPVEQGNFTTTPDYKETVQWLTKLCDQSPEMEMISIGKTAYGREIKMVLASSNGVIKKGKQVKPLLFIQAGIHAGEIDGKDAGLMLLRDIAFGNKKSLLQEVNILFIPILNIDGHERSSEFNRVNQRGPTNMGWRTNARNLNLNRDYAKVDSEEIRAVIQVMNEYQPTLYLDLHVTDGADYQYDITFGFAKGYSPQTYSWLEKQLQPALYKDLQRYGHIPGPLMFAANDRDFTKGNIEYEFSPRFSNNYGDLRHLPSILVENHSLKPFKQRVLGTYVFLESVLKVLAADGLKLMEAVEHDTKLRSDKVVLSWQLADKPDTMSLLGIESKLEKSQVTSKDYIVWTGKPVTQKIPYIKNDKPKKVVDRPQAYWVPGTYRDVIDRLKVHGIQMEEVKEAVEVPVTMYKIHDAKFSPTPFEGHFSLTCNAQPENRKETFYPGAVKIPTDQPLGDLLISLLEPESSDSFLQWGFFPEIFNRTEYIEEYAIEPLARRMLAENENLKKDFEKHKKENPEFINDPALVYEWFYSRSPYVDQRYLLYPVGIQR